MGESRTSWYGKDSEGVKREWVGMGVLHTHWYKSYLSHALPYILCVLAGVQLCVCMCVFVPLHCRGLIIPQDASAAGRGLSAGGTLLPRECGFFGV